MQAHALFAVIYFGIWRRTEGFECGLRGCKRELRPVCAERWVSGQREVVEFGNPCLMARANDCGGGFMICGSSENFEQDGDNQATTINSLSSQYSTTPLAGSTITDNYLASESEGPISTSEASVEPTTGYSTISAESTNTEDAQTSEVPLANYQTTDLAPTSTEDTTSYTELPAVTEPMTTLTPTMSTEGTTDGGSALSTEFPSTTPMITSSTTDQELANTETEFPSSANSTTMLYANAHYQTTNSDNDSTTVVTDSYNLIKPQ